MNDRFSRPTLNAFVSVLALNTPLKIFSKYDDKLIEMVIKAMNEKE